MDWRIPLADLDYGPEEEQAVLDVMRRRWLSLGAVTQAFEHAFSEFLGVKHAFAVANGTTALHLACLALGIGVGDEVIVPSLTFVASANAVLYTGADLRFADITAEDDLNISPVDIARQISPRSKAILVVHYGGYPCGMPQIMELANRNGLAVIEDAAHAPGALLEGRSMGTWGDIGCFSFFSNKNLATGEGGMVVTDNDILAERLRLLRSHGMTTLTWDRHRGHASSYDVVTLGYNYRIDELRSALGLVQLGKLWENNLRRRHLTHLYWKGLKDSSLAGIKVPFQHAHGESSHHILPVLLPKDTNRQAFMEAMRAFGVQTSIHYPPIHRFSYHAERYPGVALPVTEAVAAREVTLPLYPTMSDQDVDYVLMAAATSLATARGREAVLA